MGIGRVKGDMAVEGRRWREGIAIVGMSARFPGCRSVGEYWEKIAAGVSLLSSPSDDELRAVGIDPELAEAMHFVRSGTRLEDAESFDAKFFEMSRREAEMMDPQQRILLECAYEALENAGMTGDGARVGVFAGVGMNTYMMQLLGNPEMLAAAGGYQLMLGNDKDFMASRVAYKLNLRGPAVVVQTACSTSLAAVHLACQSLLSGECDSALAGGVSVPFPQVAGYAYIPGMILSPDGLCRPFDEKAHGTVPGRGAGLVVLKRLSDAVADGDTIYAVIAGSAWNNDGSDKVGYTAPSVAGQAEVIRGAYAAAGIGPERIGYVEAHGTGTELGDPIEVAALAEVFGAREPDAPRCVLGAVKANMGHADVAAGVAGLIKAALAVHHGVIPPTLNFERANPALGLERTPFTVSAESAAWPVGESERWAGVSSFGIGGTNVHVCLRNAPAVKSELAQGPFVFPVSAKTERALEASVARLEDFVTASAELALPAVATTLQAGRRTYGFRRAVVAESDEELTAVLGKPTKTDSASTSVDAAAVAFLFPGQGLQFAGMAKGLYARDERFREQIVRGLACLPHELAERILAAICGDESSDVQSVMDTAVAQPLLFLVEYALAMRWMELGVRPAVLLGHSLGELTAAAVAGVFSFEDGLRLAAERGRLMQETAEGAMLAVSLSAEDVGTHLTSDLWIAAENGPKLTVISGSVEAVEDLVVRLAAARVAAVRLATDRAFHTPHVAEAARLFYEAVAKVERSAPKLRWLSNVTGTWITAVEAMSPRYWADQMTARVRFAENAVMLAKGYFLLEVGPGDALIALVRQHDRAGIKAAQTASSLGGAKRSGDDYRAFLEAAAKAWERGVDLRWEALPGYPTAGRRKVALPTYPFERERFWVESKGLAVSVAAGQGAAHAAAELTKRADLASWFYAPTWERTPAAGVVQPKPAEAIAVWVIAGAGGDTGFVERLAAGLEQGGARVLRLPVWDSRAELEGFWREHRGVEGNWGLIDCRMGGDGDAAGFDSGFAGLLEILQTATRTRVRFEQVELVADGLVEVMGEAIAAGRGGIVEGMVRMLPAEFARLRARVIDPGLGLGIDAERAADAVRAEIATVATGIPTVVYRPAGRDLVRWRETWIPVRMEAVQESRFRRGGVYVITGGMGGIGYILARHLLGTYGAKVALLGRTVLPAREQWEEWLTEHGPADATSVRIQHVKELEALGGELLLLAADVADEAAMVAAWETIEARWGQVHGVIHAAGMPSTDRIMAHSAATFESVLRPKVRGSEVLAGLMAGKTVDFLLFCSSISAVLTVPAAAAYAAANAFQDRYAIWCRQQLGVPAVSINLDRWRDVGMASEVFAPVEFEDLKQMQVAKAMTPEEGIEVLERVLASGEARMLASTLDMREVFAKAESRLHPFSTMEAAGAGKASAASEFAGSAETLAVMAIWRELLGADLIEPGDNFFELGGHSLLGTMVLARIREQFGVDLSIRAIFEAPTPESLGSRIRLTERVDPVPQPVAAGGEREEFEI